MHIDKSSIAALDAVIDYFGNQPGDSLAYGDYRDPAAGERIVINDPATMTEGHVAAILHKMSVYGYALVKTDGADIREGTVTAIAEKLQLGDPFVPPYYAVFKGRIGVNSGINTITFSGQAPAAEPGDMASVMHKAFETAGGQGLHVDGTVQRMGQIKTSILLCHTRAEEGGYSMFFNSIAAFRDLVENDPDGAIAMMDERALARALDIDLANPHIGPVFSLADGRLYSRFSIDKTSYWDGGFQSVPNLRRAHERFVQKIHEGSPCYRELLLENGEAVVMANARIAHGRTAYRSYPQAERKMYRALYEASPGI